MMYRERRLLLYVDNMDILNNGDRGTQISHR